MDEITPVDESRDEYHPGMATASAAGPSFVGEIATVGSNRPGSSGGLAVIVEKLRQEVLVRQANVEKALHALASTNKELTEAVAEVRRDMKTFSTVLVGSEAVIAVLHLRRLRTLRSTIWIPLSSCISPVPGKEPSHYANGSS